MTEAEFREKRRQKFLTERYFRLNRAFQEMLVEAGQRAISKDKANGEVDPSPYGGIFTDRLKLLRLSYTAGEPIESLKPLFAEVMKWLDEWHAAEYRYSVHLAQKRGEDLRLDMTPVEFGDLFHYQMALDVISLGLLLGEPDAVRHAATLMQSARHTDMLYEYLIERVVPDPDTTIAEFFHAEPYDPLLDAIYTAKTPEESAAYVKKYLDGWYKAFDGVPWHDGHLVQTEEYSNYEGYWAFEAAAVCVLHDIDDSSFRDHLIYPKDLADWARAHHVKDLIKLPVPGATTTTGERLRCEAGQPCPRTGFWFTPARAGSRQRFEAGQVMPEVGGDYGTTIWQWDDQQG